MTEFNEALDNWIDDLHTELAILDRAALRETDAYKQFAAAWFRARSNENRRKGALAAAQTRSKNKSKGITQKNIKGTTKQKKWASEIRGRFLSAYSAGFPVAAHVASDMQTSASLWIENRDDLGSVASRIENLCADCDAAAGAYDAHLAGLGVRPGERVVLDDEGRRLAAELRAANGALAAFIG